MLQNVYFHEITESKRKKPFSDEVMKLDFVGAPFPSF